MATFCFLPLIKNVALADEVCTNRLQKHGPGAMVLTLARRPGQSSLLRKDICCLCACVPHFSQHDSLHPRAQSSPASPDPRADRGGSVRAHAYACVYVCVHACMHPAPVGSFPMCGKEAMPPPPPGAMLSTGSGRVTHQLRGGSFIAPDILAQ